jgi:PilZ domain
LKTSQPPISAPTQVERRFHQRRKISETLEIDWGSSVLQGTVTDIGPSGLFVELTPQLWVGARFAARLKVTPPLGLICAVRRVEPGKGMGVTFVFSEETGGAQLATLLATLPLP